MTILIFNRRIAGKYINIRNEESFFEYYYVIKNGQAWSNLSQSTLGFIGFAHPTAFNHIIILKKKKWFPYSLNIYM